MKQITGWGIGRAIISEEYSEKEVLSKFESVVKHSNISQRALRILRVDMSLRMWENILEVRILIEDIPTMIFEFHVMGTGDLKWKSIPAEYRGDVDCLTKLVQEFVVPSKVFFDLNSSSNFQL